LQEKIKDNPNLFTDQPEIVPSLPPAIATSSMSLSNLDWDSAKFFKAILENGNVTGVMEMVRRDFDLYTLSKAGNFLLGELIRLGHIELVINLLPEVIFLDKINIFGSGSDKLYLGGQESEPGKYLDVLIRNGLGESLFLSTIDDLNLETITESSARILSALDRNGYSEKIIDRLPEKIDVLRTNKNEDSLTTLKQGWVRGELRKTGSGSYVYSNLSSDPPKILFRTTGISQDALNQYQAAHRVLPHYVSGSNYPELSADRADPVLRKGGYREVYAGVALSSLDFSIVPPKMIKEINNQKYIDIRLSVEGIVHGHPHDDNFNLRFFLTDSKGNLDIERHFIM